MSRVSFVRVVRALRARHSATGFSFVPAAEIVMSASGRLLKCVFSDATHLKRLPYIGNVFSTIGLDTSCKLRPLTVTYLLDNECERAWAVHYHALNAALPQEFKSELLDIGDQDKGEAAAREAVMPELKTFFCSRHRMNNVLKNCRKAARGQFEAAVRCTRKSTLERTIAAFDPKLKEYLSAGPENALQFPAAAIASGRNYIGYDTSNNVESWNNRLHEVHVTSSPPFEAAMQLVGYCVQKFHKNKAQAAACAHACPPNILKRISEKETKRAALQDYVVKSNGPKIFLVAPAHYPRSTMLVNLNAPPGSRCTCEKEKLDDGLPTCVHILACVSIHGKDIGCEITDLVPRKYSTLSWRAGYECVNETEICAPATADLMEEEGEPMELALTTKRARGRPSAVALGKRRKSWSESRSRPRKGSRPI